MKNEVHIERETLINRLSDEIDSPLSKYQELYIGSNSIFDLLKYEFLTLFLSSIPGAFGIFLRKVFYKKLFANIGKGTAIGPYVTLRCPTRISIGNNVFVDNNAVLDAKGSKSYIHLGDSVLVGRNTILSCASAPIEIGSDVSIGPNCYIRAGLCQISLGSHVTIGSNSAIVSGSPGYERLDIPMKSQVGSTKGITIGDDVLIGVGVKIIDGVKIGHGSVIGAGAVVMKNIPNYAIAAGRPPIIIGSRTDQN